MPSIAYSYPVTPCSSGILNQWDTQILAAIKSKYGFWTCTSTALLQEGKLQQYGLGCSPLRIEYNYRNALALVTSLNTSKGKHGRLTKSLLEQQTQQLNTAAQGHLQMGPQCQTPIGTSVQNAKIPPKAITMYVRARQDVCIHNSNLRLTRHGQAILTENFNSNITKAPCRGHPVCLFWKPLSTTMHSLLQTLGSQPFNAS